MESTNKRLHISQTGLKKSINCPRAHGPYGGCLNTIKREKKSKRRRKNSR